MFLFRDYIKIFDLSKNCKVDFGRIFVPQDFMSKHPEIPDEELVRQRINEMTVDNPKDIDPNIEKLKKRLESIGGEKCERSFFTTMKEFYDEANEQVFGFSGLEVFQKVKGGCEGMVEKDGKP